MIPQSKRTARQTPPSSFGGLGVTTSSVTPLFFACEALLDSEAFSKMRALSSRMYIRILNMKTYSAKPETVKRDWFVVDATDKVLGRLASEIAHRLRGKHKPVFTPHVDTGDYIVVINADKIRVTGNKEEDKLYHRHSGYPGGLKTVALKDVRSKNADRIITSAVRGMLPKNPLGRAMLGKLRVYNGTEHNHQAQQPKTLEI
jgi:large subunit ribosomal protein L13